MIFAVRKFHWLSCAACCALAGCCLAPKSRAACGACVPSAIAEVPTTYENYTPPQPALKPIPTPGVELPPTPNDPPPASPEDLTVPPPPTTRAVPDSRFDYFEPAANRLPANTR